MHMTIIYHYTNRVSFNEFLHLEQNLSCSIKNDFFIVGGGYASSTAAVTVHCASGSKVYILCDYARCPYAARASAFSGFLIYAGE